jgi:glycosyltransferase involved in cell wall biosynthesis
MFHDDQIDKNVQRPTSREVTILSLSRIVKEKGVYELIEAFDRLYKEHKHIRLVIAGTGPEEQSLQEQVLAKGLQRVVRFPGFIKGEDKRNQLKETDIFALPTSHGEGCPVALLEAMASGSSVLVTPVAAIPDIVKDGVNGVVVDSVTDDQVYQGLKRLITDDGFRFSSGQQNIKEAWGKYSGSVVSAGIVKILREVAHEE